ncbi:hypothetical protein [Pseudaminobacter soli (ex Li et al. 2025)]|uniref:Uncharacterized protein n=1 Tax=Pseudaminobacter soli (ex Li et al. 2025) TaxID=1295366 RepID=A0A2P7RTV3_9HYPH|nr:hypothetical protein [Mesorhizobium soli]PSJ53651.1 hypothetical protein C7I85_27910 [Mesorhizobium soli]
MKVARAAIEAEIERLLCLLDNMDGDPDLEPDPLEEQHDAEAELTWNSGLAPDWFVIAERARQKAPQRP